MASRRQARWVPALPPDSCQRLGVQIGHRPHLHALRDARHGDQFPGQWVRFRGWAGEWRPCAGDLSVLGRCGPVAGRFRQPFRPVSRFQWRDSRFPQISQSVTRRATRCAFPACRTPAGRDPAHCQLASISRRLPVRPMVRRAGRVVRP